ncbi:unnamed protein product, partial [Meganyctiphanes norvegica]
MKVVGQDRYYLGTAHCVQDTYKVHDSRYCDYLKPNRCYSNMMKISAIRCIMISALVLFIFQCFTSVRKVNQNLKLIEKRISQLHPILENDMSAKSKSKTIWKEETPALPIQSPAAVAISSTNNWEEETRGRMAKRSAVLEEACQKYKG